MTPPKIELFEKKNYKLTTLEYKQFYITRSCSGKTSWHSSKAQIERKQHSD